MTPSEIKHYLTQCRQATLLEMARHFNAEPSAVEGALDVWLRKGRVIRRTAAKCRGCNRCSTAQTNVYEWQA